MEHKCQLYVNARGEVINPHDQDGIGCPVCMPPNGRVGRPTSIKSGSGGELIG